MLDTVLDAVLDEAKVLLLEVLDSDVWWRLEEPLDGTVVPLLRLLDGTVELMLEGLLDEILISLLKLLVAVPTRLLVVKDTAENVLSSPLKVPLGDALVKRLLLLTELVNSLLGDVPWVLPEGGLGLLVVEDVARSDIESDVLWVVRT